VGARGEIANPKPSTITSRPSCTRRIAIPGPRRCLSGPAADSPCAAASTPCAWGKSPADPRGTDRDEKEAKAWQKLCQAVGQSQVAPHKAARALSLASGCLGRRMERSPCCGSQARYPQNEALATKASKPKRPTLRNTFSVGPYVGACDGGWEGVLERPRHCGALLLGLVGEERRTTSPGKLRPDGPAAWRW